MIVGMQSKLLWYSPNCKWGLTSNIGCGRYL